MAAPGDYGAARPARTSLNATAPSDALSELAAVAGSTVTPSAQVPSASKLTTLRSTLPQISEAASLRQADSNRALLLPPCVVLGVTLPLLGLGWFTLERHRVLRDNSLGLALPILLFVSGAIFLGLVAAMLLASPRRGRPGEGVALSGAGRSSNALPRPSSADGSGPR